MEMIEAGGSSQRKPFLFLLRFNGKQAAAFFNHWKAVQLEI